MSLLSNRPTNQGVVDVSDRVARALGIVSGTVAVSNFPAQDVIDRVGRLLGHVTVDAPLPPLVAGAAHVGSVNVDNFPSSTAVSGTVDVTDRAARLVGHVSVDSLPAGGIDVTDRSGRIVGHVTVDNFPATQPISGTVGVNQVSDPWKDHFTSGQTLADQVAGTQTYTFSKTMNLIWVYVFGNSGTGDGRADPFGGTPTASAGIFCPNGVPVPVSVDSASIKVFIPASCSASVWGFSYV